MEKEKSSVDAAMSTASSTAHMAKGMLKAGKSISGAAAGGPYGAVIGAVLGAHKHFGKICALSVTVLLLPILFTLMLPSLILGGLTGALSTDGLPILNDNAAVQKNINDITASINQILGEGIDDVTRRIADDFSQTGGDNYEIINPYERQIVCNTNLLIGQYCALKAQDWENLSLNDMEDVLRQGKGQLYTFSRTSEIRTIPDDPATEENESRTEIWYIYTVVYQGEGYFADQIFHLADEQKALAGDYAQNLSMFLCDGMFQHTDTSGSILSLGDVHFTDGATEVVYFNQLDERYANKPYGTDNIGGYGCGPVSMSIVISSLTGNIVKPPEMAVWAYSNGYWCSKSGSYHSLIPGAAKEWGLPVSGCTASEPQRIIDALSSGKLVVAIMSKGHFTSSGHFIVLRGVQGDKILVADPASTSRSQKTWDLSIILDEASKRAGAGGPFWIIG